MNISTTVYRREHHMLHGSTEVVNWLIEPIKFFIDWIQWPFQVVSSHF